DVIGTLPDLRTIPRLAQNRCPSGCGLLGPAPSGPAGAEAVQQDPGHRGAVNPRVSGAAARGKFRPGTSEGLETTAAALISAQVTETAKPPTSSLMRRSGETISISRSARQPFARVSEMIGPAVRNEH